MAEKLNVQLFEFSDEELPERFGEIKDDWESTLKSKVQKVWDNLHAKIPDESAYLEKLAIPSYTNFYNFVNPNFPKATRAILKQRFGVLAGATYFLNNVYYAIGMDQRFSDGVTNNKGKFESRVRLMWRITGDNDKAVGLLPKLAMALEGDIVKLSKYIGGDDQVNVMEYDCPPAFDIKYLNMCVSAIVVKFTEIYRLSRLILQGGGDPLTLKDEFETFTSGMISAFAHPDIDPTNSAITMGYDDTKDKYYVQVVLVTTA